jgi:hypothetical protein
MEEQPVSSPHPSLEDGKEPDRSAKSRQPISNPPPYEPLASPSLRRLPKTYEELEDGGGFHTVNIYPGILYDPVVCDIIAY